MVLLTGGASRFARTGTICAKPNPPTSAPGLPSIFFRPDTSFELAECPDLARLGSEIDQVRTSDNVFYAVRVEGMFSLVHTRAMCHSEEGVPLATAAAHRARVPAPRRGRYAGGLLVAGVHADARSPRIPSAFPDRRREAGGRLLGCSGRGLRVQVQQVNDLHVAFRRTKPFCTRSDPRSKAALSRAEQVSQAEKPK